MGKVATGSEARELIPAGGYFAFVNGMYDIGTQNSMYGPNAQFIGTFELHGRRGVRRDQSGNVLEIAAFIDFYLGKPEKKKPMCELAEACEKRTFFDTDFKKGFDLETAVGKFIKLKVIHKKNARGEVKAIVDTYMAIDDDDFDPNDRLPEPVTNQHYFEIKPGDTTVPDYVPKFIADMIRKSIEFGATPVPAPPREPRQAVPPQQARQPVGATSARPTPPPPPGDDDEDEPPF